MNPAQASSQPKAKDAMVLYVGSHYEFNQPGAQKTEPQLKHPHGILR